MARKVLEHENECIRLEERCDELVGDLKRRREDDNGQACAGVDQLFREVQLCLIVCMCTKGKETRERERRTTYGSMEGWNTDASVQKAWEEEDE